MPRLDPRVTKRDRGRKVGKVNDEVQMTIFFATKIVAELSRWGGY